MRLCVAHVICVRLEGHAEHRDGFARKLAGAGLKLTRVFPSPRISNSRPLAELILRADIGEADIQEVRY